jgi:class 3 adenylate cyclase
MSFVRWNSRFERLSSSPGLYDALRKAALQIDVRNVLPSVQCPTLVLHRVDNQIVAVGSGRYLAEHIGGARYVELPGGDHWPWHYEADRVIAELQEFLTGERPSPEVDRVLCTVLFTDLVGSTELAARVGDARWRELLGQHHTIVRRELERHRGHEVDNAGDGFLATFDGPARAIRCAEGVCRELHGIGLEVRAGVHTGECERVGDKVAGLAVHIAARIASSAGAGEILVSRTVKDLVAGAGIAFEDRGVHALKGVPDDWQLYAARE